MDSTVAAVVVDRIALLVAAVEMAAAAAAVIQAEVQGKMQLPIQAAVVVVAADITLDQVLVALADLES